MGLINPFLAQGGSTASEDTDFADPLTTLVISVLAILLSILFGNTGGFIPTVSAGTW